MMISVVIPAYNCEKTIVSAVESVRCQVIDSDVKFDIIVVNDGSTDNTLEVLNGYLSNNSILDVKVYSKPNGGVSSARNFGIAQAAGEWIAFLDSDDIWLEGKTKCQIDVIRKHPDLNFIGCARNHEVLRLWGQPIDFLYKARVNDLLLKMFPQTSTAIVKKSILNRVGSYREDMTHAEDGELWLRICHEGGFYYMPESMVSTGSGKRNYGESGLSANMMAMHNGTMRMLDISYDNGIISSKVKYYSLRILYVLKFIKRLINVWGRKKWLSK